MARDEVETARRDRRVVVVSAGLGVPSTTRLLADRLAEATERAADARGASVTVHHVELRPLAHALADHLVTGFASGELAAVLREVREADAVVAVTPVFAASYSGLFKTFFDVVEPGALDGTPVLLAATAGTARHSLVLEHAMRPLFAHLRAVPMPTAVFAASEDFGDTADGSLHKRIDRAAAELVGQLGATAGVGSSHERRSTPRRPVEDEFAAPTPFEALLREARGDSAG